MASKRPLSAIVDVTDVAYLVEAFQSLNSCILSFSIELTVRSGRPDFIMKGNAYTLEPASAERVLLASYHSSLRALNTRTMETALIQCLYKLDGLLAAKEMGLLPPK